MNKILIIGAQNIDLYARSLFDMQLHDSNISNISMAFGGVACNIATNLSILGNDVNLLTVFGDDHFSESAKQNLTRLQINFSESLFVKDVGNSIYIGILDKSNDLFLGLNDMKIINHLDVTFFKEKSSYIREFDILVVDNNLNFEALQYLLTTFTNKMIIMDAVSAVKAKKLSQMLSCIDILKVNMLELKTLSGKEDINSSMTDLLNKGVGSILLTNSDKEIHYLDKDKQLTTNPIKIENIENATGAGDAFLSGFIHSLIRDMSPEECLKTAKQVAYNCLLSPDATIHKT